MESLHAAFTTSPTGRRVILRPVEIGRSLVGELSSINQEWELRVDEATGAEYWFSTRTHDTLTEPPLIDDVESPVPTLLRVAEENKRRVQLSFRADPIAGDEEWEKLSLKEKLKERKARLRKIAEQGLEEPPVPTNAMTWLFNKKMRPKRVRFELIHRRFEPKQPPAKAFERENLVKNGTSVMFFSEELNRPVLGVVENGKVDPSNATTMARRSNGVAFYRVKVIRMSKRDKTKLSRKPPVYVSIEASYLEHPEEFKRRVLSNAINKLNMYTMAHGWGRWVSKCRKARHKDYKHFCARRIQKKWNLGKLKLAGFAESALILEYRRKREAELERRRKIAEKRRKDAAYKEYKRKVGITPDGINYFLTKREMQMFLYKRTQVFKRAAAVLAPYWADNDKNDKKKAMKQWKAVWRDETAHYHKAPDEDYVLAHIPEIRSKIAAATGYWHGAQDILIPKLTQTGVHQRADGTIQILDLSRWQHYQEHADGPTDMCSWILRSRVAFGAYPEGPSRLDTTKMNAMTPCINSLGQAKIACYVCLLTKEEEEKKDNFEHVIEKLAKQQEVTLFNQVKSRKARVESITRALNDATNAYNTYVTKKAANPTNTTIKTDVTPEMLEKQTAELTKATKSLHSGEETLAAWPAKPEFIRMPLEPATAVKSAVYAPERLLEICQVIENRLRKKQRIYIFSNDGHGRAGTIAACIFGRLYGMTGHDSLSRVQRTFDSRGDQLHRNKKRRKGRQLPRLSCPKHQVQRVSVLRFIDGMEREMFRDVSRVGPPRNPETGEELPRRGSATLYTRMAVRNEGVPYMAEPERILEKGRMEMWWNHREALLDKDMQNQVHHIFSKRDPDKILQDPNSAIAPGFKNIWTPRTRLQHIGKRSAVGKRASALMKKGTKAVISAVRINIFGKAATASRLTREHNLNISALRKEKKEQVKQERSKARKLKKKSERKLAKKAAKNAAAQKKAEEEKKRAEGEKEAAAV